MCCAVLSWVVTSLVEVKRSLALTRLASPNMLSVPCTTMEEGGNGEVRGRNGGRRKRGFACVEVLMVLIGLYW